MMEFFPQMVYPDSFNNRDAPYKMMLSLREVKHEMKLKEQKQLEDEMNQQGSGDGKTTHFSLDGRGYDATQ